MLLRKTFTVLFILAFMLSWLGSGFASPAQDTERIRVYRVQFAASKTFIQPSYFKTKFKLDKEVQYFVKDGWYKYYVGNFSTEAEATAYYHETNDVGYVISSIIDEPIEIVEDSVQAVISQDSMEIEQEDTTTVGLSPTDSLERVFLNKIQMADSALRASDYELAKKLFTETSAMKPDLLYSSLQLEKIDQIIEEGDYRDGEGRSGELTLFKSLIVFFGGILIFLIIRYLIIRKRQTHSADELSDENLSENFDHFLSGKKPFAFLDNSDRSLSGWEQLRLYEAIKEKKLHVPEFDGWLDSDNSSIATFCLRMVRSFGQTGAYKSVVRLLDHEDDEIRAEAIVTLGELGNRQVLGLLRERFDQETYTNRMLTLRAMARMPEASNIDFLKELLKNAGDFRIESAHALASIKSFGIEGVEKALQDLGEDSETIARHILINKL